MHLSHTNNFFFTPLEMYIKAHHHIMLRYLNKIFYMFNHKECQEMNSNFYSLINVYRKKPSLYMVYKPHVSRIICSMIRYYHKYTVGLFVHKYIYNIPSYNGRCVILFIERFMGLSCIAEYIF